LILFSLPQYDSNGANSAHKEDINMKKMRKEATLGIILLAVWLVIRVLFNGSGFLLWLLGIAGLAVVIVGFLPDNLHAQVMEIKNKLLNKVKK
jgi:hypothetical protein